MEPGGAWRSQLDRLLGALAKEQLIEPGFSCGIDLDEQERYLQSQGRDTADMTERELREANTGTHVFLDLDLTPIDAIEDVHVKIYL